MSDLNFIYRASTNEMSEDFHRMREKHIRESLYYDDSFYLTSIFKHLNNVYSSFSCLDRKKLKKSKEVEITDCIRRELQGNDMFTLEGFIVNTEARNQDRTVGYYDLKFENTYWSNQYFVMECKPIDMTNQRLKAYIHTSKNGEDDGGLFRFLINKYATNKPYGGMLGYIVANDPEAVVVNLKSKIISFKTKRQQLIYGDVIDTDLLDEPIQDFINSFQSNHNRIRGNEVCLPIHIFHLFMDFTN